MSLSLAPVSAQGLVPVSRYRILTGDTSTVDALVEAALVDAVQLVEEYLRRPLERAARTERLRLYRWDGVTSGFDGAWAVYPRATPIDAVATTGYVVQGAALVGVTPDDGPWLYGQYETGGYATVTYTGGWTADTIPVTVARAVAMIARNLLAAGVTDLPAGASMVQVGDVRIGFGPEGASSGPLDASSRSALRRYIRRRGA